MNSRGKGKGKAEDFGLTPEPDLKDVEVELYFCVIEAGIVNGSFEMAVERAFRTMQDFCQKQNVLGKATKVIGVSPDDPTKVVAEKCRYIACYQFEDDLMKTLKETEDVKLFEMPKGQYAVFRLKGHHSNIQKSYKWIARNWLPDSEYEFKRRGHPYEHYLNDPDNTKSSELLTDIYIPIVIKGTNAEEERRELGLLDDKKDMMHDRDQKMEFKEEINNKGPKATAKVDKKEVLVKKEASSDEQKETATDENNDGPKAADTDAVKEKATAKKQEVTEK